MWSNAWIYLFVWFFPINPFTLKQPTPTYFWWLVSKDNGNILTWQSQGLGRSELSISTLRWMKSCKGCTHGFSTLKARTRPDFEDRVVFLLLSQSSPSHCSWTLVLCVLVFVCLWYVSHYSLCYSFCFVGCCWLVKLIWWLYLTMLTISSIQGMCTIF